MLNKILSLGILGAALMLLPCATTASHTVSATSAAAATPISIYGAWHCGSDACTWGSVRNMTEFDNNNRWLVDRGDGRPSVNLVILSFVQPLKLLNSTT